MAGCLSTRHDPHGLPRCQSLSERTAKKAPDWKTRLSLSHSCAGEGSGEVIIWLNLFRVLISPSVSSAWKASSVVVWLLIFGVLLVLFFSSFAKGEEQRILATLLTVLPRVEMALLVILHSDISLGMQGPAIRSGSEDITWITCGLNSSLSTSSSRQEFPTPPFSSPSTPLPTSSLQEAGFNASFSPPPTPHLSLLIS